MITNTALNVDRELIEVILMNKEGLLTIRQVIEVCERLTDEEIEMAW